MRDARPAAQNNTGGLMAEDEVALDDERANAAGLPEVDVRTVRIRLCQRRKSLSGPFSHLSTALTHKSPSS